MSGFETENRGTMMDKENQANAPQTTQLTPSKRRRLMCLPDVTIVVGGVEFQHHGPMLSLVSDYFDAALNSGAWKEAATKRIEFPEGDPEEWKELSRFFEPVHSPNAGIVTPENLSKLLPWFDFLGMSHLLEVSEKCLREAIFKDGATPCSRYIAKHNRRIVIGSCATNSRTLERLRSEAFLLCSSFEICIRYFFSDLQLDILQHLVRVLSESPDIFTQESVDSLVFTLSTESDSDADTKKTLWNALKVYLPKHIQESSEDLPSLWNSPLLSSLIFVGMESYVVKSRNRLLPKVLVDEVLLRGSPRPLSGAEVKRGLRALLRKFPGLMNETEDDDSEDD